MHYLPVIALLAASLGGAQAEPDKPKCDYTAPASFKNVPKDQMKNVMVPLSSVCSTDYRTKINAYKQNQIKSMCPHFMGLSQKIVATVSVKKVSPGNGNLDEVWCNDRLAELVNTCPSGGEYKTGGYLFTVKPNTVCTLP